MSDIERAVSVAFELCVAGRLSLHAFTVVVKWAREAGWQ